MAGHHIEPPTGRIRFDPQPPTRYLRFDTFEAHLSCTVASFPPGILDRSFSESAIRRHLEKAWGRSTEATPSSGPKVRHSRSVSPPEFDAHWATLPKDKRSLTGVEEWRKQKGYSRGKIRKAVTDAKAKTGGRGPGRPPKLIVPK